MLSVNVAVLVSGGGTNLQALIDAQKRGELGRGEIKLVISNRKNAYALQRAENNGIETAYVKMRRGDSACENELLELLQKKGIDMLVLAGYLAILGENIINAYRNRIINIHPSLIPSFCGMGYYGLKVHEAALAVSNACSTSAAQSAATHCGSSAAAIPPATWRTLPLRARKMRWSC